MLNIWNGKYSKLSNCLESADICDFAATCHIRKFDYIIFRDIKAWIPRNLKMVKAVVTEQLHMHKTTCEQKNNKSCLSSLPVHYPSLSLAGTICFLSIFA